jgi:hypothetical protein
VEKECGDMGFLDAKEYPRPGSLELVKATI